MRLSICAGLLLAAPTRTWGVQQHPESCGQVVTIETHAETRTRYALARPGGAPGRDKPITLVLLVGGGGHLDLDDKGCPRALKGNSLVRSLPDFHAAGFATALVDAPSDHPGDDGLAGFRIAEQHADDLGKVIADVRTRTKGPVWVVGTSRGTISAVNAASRLTGTSAADGLVLTSAVTSGGTSRYRPWVTQTVFDLPLEAIRMPVLVVGHADDKCVRSPAAHMGDITDRTNGSREQVVTVTGGPGSAASGADVCEGRAPHGFIYLVFNEGYSATAGDDWMRPELCDDALRLGRILAELVPQEAEVHGLVALMEIQASRVGARTGPAGEPILLLDQNRALWDRLLIRRGLAALERAEALGGAPGPYASQAAIAACHARARAPAETDWARIAALYQELARVAPSPVVELNRAVAIAMAEGPAAGLELVDALTSEPSLERYHLLPSVRGDLLAKLDRFDEARAEFERAASLARNGRERTLLLERAAACARGSAPPQPP